MYLFTVHSTLPRQPDRAWSPHLPSIVRTHGERQFLAWNIYNLNWCGRWEVDSGEFSFIINGHLNWRGGKWFSRRQEFCPLQVVAKPLLTGHAVLSSSLFHGCKRNRLSTIFWTEEKCKKQKKKKKPSHLRAVVHFCTMSNDCSFPNKSQPSL